MRHFIATALLLGTLPGPLSTHLSPPSNGRKPPTVVLTKEDDYRTAYLERIAEVQDWVVDRIDPTDLPETMGTAAIVVKLVKGEDIDLCNRRTIELMKEPSTGPFWMFPVTMVAFAGRDQLSDEARHRSGRPGAQPGSCAATPRTTG